ncbi:MAG: endonuclease/exonuclease/phosphatase family protein [Nocardioides sp.]
MPRHAPPGRNAAPRRWGLLGITFVVMIGSPWLVLSDRVGWGWSADAPANSATGSSAGRGPRGTTASAEPVLSGGETPRPTSSSRGSSGAAEPADAASNSASPSGTPAGAGTVQAARPQPLRDGFRFARLTTSFRIGTLNILGSQHTVGKGGYGPGTDRAGISAGLVKSRAIDVMALQEVQDDQLTVLNSALSGYTIWPGQTLGNNGQRLQLAWRSDRFDLVDSGSVTHPFDRQLIPLPYALLRDRNTGADFWVIVAHNSARDLEGERDAATSIEIALINRLQADGTPVFIAGDMNETSEFYCRVSAATGMTAANGGSAAGSCVLPPPPLRIDWIMGSRVDFSGYVQDGASLPEASDHFLLYANVTLATSD